MMKRLTRALRVALIGILVMALTTAPAMAKSISVRLNAAAKVYQTASTSARSVTAPKNLKVKLKAYKNGWGMITYKGHTGYIKLKYLDREQRFDRLGGSEEYVEYLGNRLVCYTVPVSPGRNIAVIVESAAVNFRQKRMGYDAMEELTRRLEEKMKNSMPL